MRLITINYENSAINHDLKNEFFDSTKNDICELFPACKHVFLSSLPSVFISLEVKEVINRALG